MSQRCWQRGALGDLAGKTFTANALLTQTTIASFLRQHDAHYLFIAKDNHKTLLGNLRLWFEDDAQRPPDFVEHTGKPTQGKPPAVHGRWEQREVRTTTALNDYLRFPGVGQAPLTHRPNQNKNQSWLAFGLTMRPGAESPTMARHG